jgi:formamidopyrimidine-DNA glycosylase
MLELPEAAVIAEQINDSVRGKKIRNVTTAASPHKFAWYFGDPQGYHELLSGRIIGKAVNYGGLVEIKSDDVNILLGDGVSIRYYFDTEKLPEKHQLHVEFEDDSHLICSVQMYGGLWAFKKGQNENPYYLVAKEKVHPLSVEFSKDYFDKILSDNSDKLSLKAFLATEQRIPGLGNGVLQDILFNAGLHPKRKLKTLADREKGLLYDSIKSTIADMTFQGGRDTERDLFGCFGGYKTKLSKNTVDKPCDKCGTVIKKEAYMGGSIYYCGGCQSL